MESATILVVDDDPDFVEIMRIVLQSADYKVVSASNSVEALRQIKAERPDLMLLDIMMANMTDGLDFAEQIRADLALRDLPIIIVTSIADTPHAGLVSTDATFRMDAWISKPVKPKHLLETVGRVLGTVGRVLGDER